MGSRLSRALAAHRSRNDFRVLLIGLNGAGKSSIVTHIRKVTQTSNAFRDVAQFDVQKLRVGKSVFSLWDIGGTEALRPYWRHHYLGTQGVVFVVDASDRESLATAAAELRAAASDLQLSDAAFVVLANKADTSTALSAAELSKALNLPTLLAGHPWHVQASSSTTGAGLKEAWAFLEANMKAL